MKKLLLFLFILLFAVSAHAYVTCQSCGFKRNYEDDEFCINCMKKLDKSSSSRVTSKPKAKKNITNVANKDKTYQFKENYILLFPYQVVEGSAAKDGLYQDFKEMKIIRAKPAVFSKREAKIEVIRKFKVIYDNGVKINVCEVMVETNTFKMLDGRIISFKKLGGFVLAKRL